MLTFQTHDSRYQTESILFRKTIKLNSQLIKC